MTDKILTAAEVATIRAHAGDEESSVDSLDIEALCESHEAIRRDRHTPDEIRAINQAAAYLDGVLALSYNDKKQLALTLFQLAGNPMPAAAR